MNSQEATFKLDTGAEITVVSEEFYRTFTEANLNKTTRILFDLGRNPLDVTGELKLHCHMDNISQSSKSSSSEDSAQRSTGYNST